MGIERQSNSSIILLQNSLFVKPNRYFMLKIICKDDGSAAWLCGPYSKAFLLATSASHCTLHVNWDVSLSFLCLSWKSLMCWVQKLLIQIPPLNNSFRYGDFQGNLPFVLLLLMGDLLPCFYCLLLLLTFYSPISLISFYPPMSSQLTAKAFSFLSSPCLHILLRVACLLLLHSCLLELSLFCCL